MTPQQAADDFDRAVSMTAAALDDLGQAWLALPAELRAAVMGEGEVVTVGNEAGTFSVRIYEIGGDEERPYVHNRWGLADGG